MLYNHSKGTAHHERNKTEGVKLMDSAFEELICMTYDQQCKFLQQKYGLPPKDYFPDERCINRVRSNSRTSEGLVIHHNAEKLNNVGSLGDVHIAHQYPFDYQKRENLTYCTLIEHMLFHLKINLKRLASFTWPYEILRFDSSHGFFWITHIINSLYQNYGSSTIWLNNCYSAIKDQFNDYVLLLRGISCFLKCECSQKEYPQIDEGSRLTIDINVLGEEYPNALFEVRKIVKEKNIVILRLNDSRVPKCPPLNDSDMDSDMLEACVSEVQGIAFRVFMLSEPYQEELDSNAYMNQMNKIIYDKTRANMQRIAYWMNRGELLWPLSRFKNMFDTQLLQMRINDLCDRLSYLDTGVKWKELSDALEKPYNEHDIRIATLLSQNCKS